MSEPTPKTTNSSATGGQRTCIGRTVVAQGQIVAGEDLLIEGQFDGNISLNDHCLTVGPEGRVKADAPKVVLPDREKMKTEMEALIYHFKIVTEGFTVPAGEVYQAIESPRGEMGYYVVSDGTAKPYRVHMRSPSFANLQTLTKMCEGRLIADVVAAIGSIDIVLGDCDR